MDGGRLQTINELSAVVSAHLKSVVVPRIDKSEDSGLKMNNTDSMKTLINSHGAKGKDGDEKDITLATVITSIPQTSTENSMSVPKSNTLSLSKHLSRDSSVKALSGAQQTLFIHTGAPNVSNAKLILPTGTTVSSPVPQFTSTKSSILKQADIPLSISQSLCQSVAVSSSSSHFVQSVQVPALSGSSNKVQTIAPSPVLLLVPNLVPFQGQVNTKSKMLSPLPIVESKSVLRSNTASTSKLYCTESEKMKDNGDQVNEKAVTNVCQTENLNDIGLNWDPQKEFMQFLLTKEKGDDQVIQIDDDSEVQANFAFGRKRKRKMDIVRLVDFSELEIAKKHQAPKKTPVATDGLEPSEVKMSVIKPKYLPAKKNFDRSAGDTGSNLPKETVEAIKHLIFSDYKLPVKNLEAARSSAPATTYIEEGSPFGSTVFPPGSAMQIDDVQTGSESPSDDDIETEPSFYPCTKCNVNFREKKHLQRHMMYHLEGHSKTNLPRPYICKECGIAFRDRAPLQKHRSLHQEKRERLMEEIRELRTFQDEGRDAKLQCPQCVFGTNCPKTFVQHAKTHEKDKRYYCCDKCNFMAASVDELEGHQIYIHDAVINKSNQKPLKGVSLENLLSHCKSGGVYVCRKCPFTTPARSIFKKHVKYLHQRLYHIQHKHDRGTKMPGLNSKPFNVVSSNKATFQHSDYPHKFTATSFMRHNIKMASEESGALGNSSELYRKVCDVSTTEKTFYTATKKVHYSSGSTVDYDSSPKMLMGLNTGSEKANFLQQGHGEFAIKRNETALLSKNDPLHRQIHVKSEEHLGIEKDLCPKSNTLIQNRHKDAEYTLNFRQCLAEEVSGEMEYADPRAVSVRKSVKDVMLSVSVASDLLDQYPSVFHKAPVVVLNKLDPCVKKFQYDEEENPLEDDSVESINCIGGTGTIAANDFDLGDEQDHYFTEHFTSTEVQIGDENGIDDYDFDTYDESDEDDDDDYDNFDNNVHDYGNSDYSNQRLYSRLEYQDAAHSNFGHQSFQINSDGKCIEVMDPVVYQQDAPLNITYNWTDFHTEKRPCPYCPAVFDTGVGLSNHVRGHLYRVGLTYDARHLVPPEQIASNDKRRRIKKNNAPVRRIKKEVKSGSSTENTCPLCGGWFDTKVGLSNHVRGHLKRLGKTELEAHKSPLSILTELMQNEAEAENIAKLLNSKQFRYKPFVSQKFATSEGLFLAPNGITIKLQQNEMKAKPFPLRESGLHSFSTDLESKRPDGERHVQTSSLMQLLKTKFGDDASSLIKTQPRRSYAQTAKKRLPNQKRPLHSQPNSSFLQPSTSSQSMTNMDIVYQAGHPVKLRTCVHCHATFTSAVSLANHLRVYARKKQAGDLTGTPFDCKQKRSRSRSGIKKKSSLFVPSLDDGYVLKCRFCDLVFRGPLSVQEDWIKHLQRHVVNANLPRTGAGMVEVLPPSKESFPVTESSFSLLMAQAAS
ncbi:zinc finger protein 644 [Callorhinchus milii]|nr:zinc finger protein 644 [Callorhinchus milii]|eukprot:gi/632940517/ref/XP_007885360.1/ PREDICTED: zinc finger protein 644 [Callorhinchus milii]